ncbi:LysE family transporter, partial [Micromonospora sp. NPDC049679]|uniref:LysE family transporter n=1 Tax=Micromonospora sp. NPDC049679 TaxID=3155920 RepID=UPI0033C45A1B
MSEVFVAGLLAGYGVAVPVGAIAILILGLTARTSLRVGAAAALGVATADGLYAVVAVLGGAALAGAIAPVAGPLRWLAAVVLLGLAGAEQSEIATELVDDEAGDERLVLRREERER